VSEPTRSLLEEQAEERLREGLQLSDGRGKPLPRRYRVGAETVEGYLQASGGGLAYMQRLREIEDDLTRHAHDAARIRRSLATAYAREPERLDRVRRRVAAEWDFSRVNDLIERHNRFYPVEARLPMDPRTGDYAKVRGESYERRPLGASWVLARI
jgi:hypothetical protein